MKLREYHRKRKPDATNEPFGDEETSPAAGEALSGAYVVHLHDATRRHYDVRLEVGGVLWSFAVPRGPSLDPAAKHLAVKTEDHPIEYLEFEDVIPEKQYGAGPMIVWDRGRVEFLEGPADEELARGKLHIKLEGLKLHGAYAFVKLAKSKKGDEWLFFKKTDAHSSTDRDILAELPRSVFSGLTVEELENAKDIGASLVARAAKKGARVLGEKETLALVVADRSPLAGISSTEPSDDELVYDAELDGLRVVASRDGDVVSIRLFDAKGTAEAVEAFYPEVVRALRSLSVPRVVLDGALVAFDPSGHPNLALLAKRATTLGAEGQRSAVATMPVVLVATDLLLLGDRDVRPLPLSVRRDLLSSLLPPLGFLRAAPPLEGALDQILAFSAQHDIVGVIAKKKSAPYVAGPARGDRFFVSSGISARSRPAIHHAAANKKAALRQVKVTNRDKVFWPDEGYTKGDLFDYYAAVADVLLPYLERRPVILVRYPDGIAGKSFYQWNVPPGMPAWVQTMSFSDEDGDAEKKGFLVDDVSTLLYIANLGCIPLHILACRVPDITEANFFTIDFDVKQSKLEHAITLATTLKELLDAIGLPSFPKTSGQSGLHVLVPLGAGQNFDTARGLADLLGKLLVERHGEIATMERVVSKRGPKVYVDTGQTGSTRAIVAPYSVRAVPGATVSTPLMWDEVTRDLDPRQLTMKTVPKRVAKHGDPMVGLTTETPNVAAAVAALSELVPRKKR